ncbi:MAG TPA: glycosyl hydrolase 53 family protein [Mucilaginibacter sp.]|jgi:beta-galactosidase
MKSIFFSAAAFLTLLSFFAAAQAPAAANPNQPSEIVVTPYKTTMIADGKDKALIKISVINKQGREITDATNLISFKISGDAKIISITNGSDAAHDPGVTLRENLHNGQLRIILQTARKRGTVIFEATAEGLLKGSTEIHTVQPGKPHPVTTGSPIAGTAKITDKIIGADISFLPQLEDRGMKFYNKDGQQEDVLKILKDHGFNYIRLRIFDHPEIEKGGYSPKKGFCDLAHTMQMAKRIKAAGMKFLLDFHYSDTWADPQRQNIPVAWENLPFSTLKDSVYTYTKSVMQALKDQGTVPEMVQIGNEINHGILWPVGEINNLDSLSAFIYEGVKAAKEVNPNVIVMLHIALGGQNEESRFFIDNMLKRKVPFDVIGLSYYPKWHGTLDDLKNNMTDLAKRYKKYVMVAEYSQLKQEVNDIAFTVPGNKALGTFIWEPLSSWESFFDRTGKMNATLEVYPLLAKKYNVR